MSMSLKTVCCQPAAGDNLGNTRITFDTATGAAATVQADNYYPFGMEQSITANGTKNDYLYNKKELQAELAEYDYGARFYDPVIGRWTTPDPKAEKYFALSPYDYVANNPLKFIDPNGKEIIVAQGSLTSQQFTQYKQNVLTSLQALSNDKLGWKGNSLVVLSVGGANSGKSLTSGTHLIRELNNKNPGHKTTTIESTTGGNQTQPASADALVNNYGTNGKGANATVSWNDSKTTSGVDVNGSTTRPVEIGLGHELIHADHDNKGQNNPNPSGKLDPDGSGQILSKEEVKTRQEENKLRIEQGVPLRKTP